MNEIMQPFERNQQQGVCELLLLVVMTVCVK